MEFVTITKMADQTIRAFIAVNISNTAKDCLEKVLTSLKAANADVKWSRASSIHLTLKFLGDIFEENVEPVCDSIKTIAVKFTPIDMDIADIGVFPSWKEPRVIWAGVSSQGNKIKQIADALEKAMFDLGFEKEKREFSPHLTLGRVKTGTNLKRLEEIAKGVKIPAARTRAEKVILYRSILSPHGSDHLPLKEIFLGKETLE
ncbi:MAG: RNA 2',3'-cyclic phosphodiesterase [Candidatus Omnitrophica bacterium]|nr:RNA 2',3'-cyclic phosphodiesterase [Candidatus Omnitrophota bacterium]